MSNEQWIIYLYGIYPKGGFVVVWTMLFVVSTFFIIFLFLNLGDHNSEEKDSMWHPDNSLWRKAKWYKFVPASVFLLLALISNLVPDKNIFLALVATPALVESLENEGGKLNRINKLMDLGIDKAIKELEKAK